MQEVAVDHAIVAFKLSKLLVTLAVNNTEKFARYLDEKQVVEKVKKNFIIALNFIRVKGYEWIKYASGKSYEGVVYLKPIVRAKSIEAGKVGMKLTKKAYKKTIDALPVLIALSAEACGKMFVQATKLVDFVKKEMHTHAEKKRLEKEARDARNKLR